MGLRKSISRFWNAIVKRDDPYLGRYPRLPASVAGVMLTEDEAMKLSVVWACGSAIVKAIAASQWNVYRLEGSKRVLLPDDPVEWMLNHDPNPESTAISVREAIAYAAVFTGNGYAEIQKTADNKPFRLWPLAASRMQPRRMLNDQADSRKGSRLVYEYYNPDGGRVVLETSDVFHLRGPSLDGLMGDNAIARASSTIGLAVAQERFSSAYFANGTMIGAVLEYPNTIDEDTKAALRADWADKHSGPDRAYKPILLEDGMKLSSVKLGSTPAEASLLDSRKFSVEDICRFFGVPLHKVQVAAGSQGYGTNIEQLGIEFVRDGIVPWTSRHEQEADRKFFPRGQPWRATKIDTGWLTQGDALTRANAAKVWISAGVKTPNEIRHAEGLDAMDSDGDTYFLDGSLKTIDQIVDPPEPPAPAAAPAPFGGKAPAMDDAPEPAPEASSRGRSDRPQKTGVMLSAFAGALTEYRIGTKENGDGLVEKLAAVIEDQATRSGKTAAGADLAAAAAQRVDDGEPIYYAARWLIGQVVAP